MSPLSEKVYYDLLLFTAGCSFLAFLYHFILHQHKREKLLFYYCVYLFFLTLFLFERVFFVKEQISPYNKTWDYHFWDELLQLLLYYGYIDFVGRALNINRQNHPLLFRAWVGLKAIMIGVTFLHTLIMLTHLSERRISILYRGSRILLIVVSLAVLATYLRRKITVFQRYIIIGALIFLVCGVVAFLSNILRFEWQGLHALTFTFPGEIADVLFFSAAMGVRIRQTYIEKEEALLALEEQRKLNMQKDMDGLKAIIETRHAERNRIASELHDEVGSSLSSIHIFSVVTEQHLEQDKGKANEMIKKIQDTSAEVIGNMSDLIWAINAETDDTDSLLRRIRQFTSALLEAKNIEFTIETDESVKQLKLKAEAKKNVLLLCKEAFNNLAKYSHATKATLAMSLGADHLRVSIIDNGSGFDQHIRKGNGLTIMERRCRTLGGEFYLQSSPGGGTRIDCDLPITRISN
jgi:signal transduction histidine kinase